MTEYSMVWTTAQAATRFQVKPASFARFARGHGVEPMARIRVGSSTVTLWSVHELADVARKLSGVSERGGSGKDRRSVVNLVQ